MEQKWIEIEHPAVRSVNGVFEFNKNLLVAGNKDNCTGVLSLTGENNFYGLETDETRCTFVTCQFKNHVAFLAEGDGDKTYQSKLFNPISKTLPAFQKRIGPVIARDPQAV